MSTTHYSCKTQGSSWVVVQDLSMINFYIVVFSFAS